MVRNFRASKLNDLTMSIHFGVDGIEQLGYELIHLDTRSLHFLAVVNLLVPALRAVSCQRGSATTAIFHAQGERFAFAMNVASATEAAFTTRAFTVYVQT
jgi:hypothetical protein